MTDSWARFLTTLESKGVSFQQIQHASDRRAVIVAAGFADPISIAILETEWIKRRGSGSGNGLPPTKNSADGDTVGVTSPLASSLATHRFADYTKLEDVPEEIQDRVVTADVLAAAVGHGGSLLQAARDGFVLSRYVPVSMRSLCKSIVPIADAFVALRKIERAEYMGKSLVAMALGEVVSEVCTSYAHEIANLQRWARSRAMPLMAVVSEILRAGHHIVRLRQVLPTDTVLEEEGTLTMPGWRLLNHISEQAAKCSGSREDDELLLLLLRRAAVPYLRILHRWMHMGVLEDPYGEFFISETCPVSGATFSTLATRSAVSRIFPPSGIFEDAGETSADDAVVFERRFSMNKSMVPSFLLGSPKVSKMVFYAGKYCCLLREYNSSLPAFGDVAEQMLVWAGPDELQRRIEESYEVASGAMLQLLFGSQVDLLGHLTSLKSYFLHQRGDWLVDFLDSAEELLLKSPVQVKVHSLRVLLQAAIAKCCSTDPYHAAIGCSFSDCGIEPSVINAIEQDEETTGRESGRKSAMRIETRRCIELLQLEADLKWPITMVIGPSVMRHFNVIFRLFTWLKTCERGLTSAWRDEHSPQGMSIRQKLLQFIRQFQFYAAHFVVEPLWGRMMARIGQAESVFAVSDALQDFFDGVERGIVLSSKHRFRSLSNILEIASSIGGTLLPMESPQKVLQSIEEKYLRALSELASPVGADYPQLIPLLTWIDFSGFYDRSGVYRVFYGAAGVESIPTATVSAAVSERRRC